MLFYILSFLAVLFLYFIYRTHWLIKNLRTFVVVMTVFFTEEENKGMAEDEKRELLQIWPLYHIYFEFYNWTFARYIIHIDKFTDACEILLNHLKKIEEKLRKALSEKND